MDLGIVVSVGLALFALVCATPLVRSARTRSTMTLLQSELAIERDARIAQEDRCRSEMAALRSTHDREVGELRGQMKLMTETFAAAIATKVAELAGRDIA